MERASAERKGHRAEAVERQMEAAGRVIDRLMYTLTRNGNSPAQSLKGLLELLAGACGTKARDDAWATITEGVRTELGNRTCRLGLDAEERIMGRLYRRMVEAELDAADPSRIFAGLPS